MGIALRSSLITGLLALHRRNLRTSSNLVGRINVLCVRTLNNAEFKFVSYSNEKVILPTLNTVIYCTTISRTNNKTVIALMHSVATKCFVRKYLIFSSAQKV